MKPLLYIHIGSPKTGTTTIQNFLNSNRKKLAEHGICYPESINGPALKGHTGHLSMVEADAKLRFDTTPWYVYRKKYYEAMLASRCNVNILSAEAFMGEPASNIDFFTKDFSVKVICYIRNFFDYRVSLQKQLIKEGLRYDVFAYGKMTPSSILGNIEDYINLVGENNCFFVNYDKVSRESNILKEFFDIVCPTFADNFPGRKANVTVSDAAIKFLYQLQFLPISRQEWNIIRRDILQMDTSVWKHYRSSFLPQHVFQLDEPCQKAVMRQGQLLKDQNWVKHTLERGVFFANLSNSDLPYEIQADLLSKLSPTSRNILVGHWPYILKNKGPFLPCMDNIDFNSFELLKRLHTAFSLSHGRNIRLRAELDEKNATLDKQKQAIAQHDSEILKARFKSARYIRKINFFSYLIKNIFCMAFPSLRQAIYIRQSGLFDVGWYIERNPDVARTGVDPILHYVRYGAHEGRDPAPWFSTRTYLEMNPGLISCNLNPFFHYIFHELKEKDSRPERL